MSDVIKALEAHFDDVATEVANNVEGFYEAHSGKLVLVFDLAAPSAIKGEEGAEKITPISLSQSKFSRQVNLSTLFPNLPNYSEASPVGFSGSWAMGGYVTCYLRENRKSKKKDVPNAVKPALPKPKITASLEDEE